MKTASIEIISETKIHRNADTLDLATVNGWQVCVKRNEFKIHDKCIYVCVDTIFDELPQYEFLRTKKFRIKSIRLRGEISQGIVFPVSLINEFDPTINTDEFEIGTEVSEIIHCKHWEKPISAQLAGEARGNRPSWVRRTDEENLQSRLKFLNELYGEPYYISIKEDGSSASFDLHDNEFVVCSRNLSLKFNPDNSFWKMAIKYNIENSLREYFGGKNYAIQGEMFGPGIQKNPAGSSDLQLKIFNVIETGTQNYLGLEEMRKFSSATNIPMVDIVEEGDYFSHTLDSLKELAATVKYPNGKMAEGIVVRPKNQNRNTALRGMLSFKVVNAEYLIKNDE
jgi:RNA ligase (TIGR02306 family)